MKERALKPDKIKILNFSIIKGAIENPFDFDNSVVAGYDFDMDYEVGFNIDEKLAKTDFQVDIKTQSETHQDEAKGLFHFSFVFSIENMEELVKKKKKVDTVQIDANLGNALASITYSTSRGILMTRFQGTLLKDFVLPVIDPNNLVNKEE